MSSLYHRSSYQHAFGNLYPLAPIPHPRLQIKHMHMHILIQYFENTPSPKSKILTSKIQVQNNSQHFMKVHKSSLTSCTHGI